MSQVTRVTINQDCKKCGKALNVLSVGIDKLELVYMLYLKWYCPYCQEETDGSTSFEELCIQAQCTVCKLKSETEDDKYRKMLEDLDNEVWN